MPLTDLEKPKVVETVDAGLGRFLQKVEVEADVVEGKFRGWRIVRFAAPEEWRGVGLQPGDVVTRINDQPIERPEQANAVFVSLKVASNLDVAYLREGRPMRLSLPIVGTAPAAPATSSPTAPAPVSPGSPPAPASPPASTSESKPSKKPR